MEVDIAPQYNQDINLYKQTFTNSEGNTQYQLIETPTLPKVTTTEYKKVWFQPTPKQRKIKCYNTTECNYCIYNIRRCTLCKYCIKRNLKQACYARRCPFAPLNTHKIDLFIKNNTVYKIIIPGFLYRFKHYYYLKLKYK